MMPYKYSALPPKSLLPAAAANADCACELLHARWHSSAESRVPTTLLLVCWQVIMLLLKCLLARRQVLLLLLLPLLLLLLLNLC